MKAAVVRKYGTIDIEDVPRPEIANPHDVIVRVAAVGVCRTDLDTVQGGLEEAYGVPVFPYVPGHETAGYVEEVGASVIAVKPGDPVILHPFATCGHCDGCRSGRDMYCTNSTFPGVDGMTWGGFAEYVRTSDRSVVPVPVGANLVELAPYSDAGITAYHAVKKLVAGLTSNTTAVILGIGGLGQFGVQLLKRMTPATVIAVELSASRASIARDLGADLVFTGTAASQIDAVRDATDGGAQVVIDFVGGDEGPNAAIKMLRKGGIFSVVGAGGGLTVRTMDLTVNELSIVGNLVGSYTDLQELVTFAGAGLESKYVPYALDQAAEALADLEAGTLDGRAVLIP